MIIIAEKANRLDKFLQGNLNEARNQVENFIKTHGVYVNGKLVKKTGFKLKGGEKIEYELPTMTKSKPKEIDFDVEIIYEDEDLLIINKPPNLVVHPAPSVKEATLVDWLKHKGIALSNLSGEERNGIVHRIDKQTSGALIIAKNNISHQSLSQQLQDRSMGRYYLAIIDMPLKDHCIVNKPLFRHPKYRTKMAINENGRVSKSAFIKLTTAKNINYELIAAKLFTGRTHQIRVHLESLSRHIIGDTLYGFKSKKDNIPRVMLHAYFIYFRHPKSGKIIHKKAPLYRDFKDILSVDFDKEIVNEKISFDYISNGFNTYI
jgi:23S rRNA pseudouridine1911/1915/1917 synthase